MSDGKRPGGLTALAVLNFVREGAGKMLLAQTSPRGFLVRSYAQVLGAPAKTFSYGEFHTEAFATEPELAACLPPQHQGTMADCVHQKCAFENCANPSAPVVGVVSFNHAGYHGQNSIVTFFTLCPLCQHATAFDSGAPADDEEYDALSA